MTSSSTPIATTPTTASSFSPYSESESSSSSAAKNIAMLAGIASSAPRKIGRRSGRRAPTRLAVIAAMIRIASSPSRKTISAELVITVVSLAPSPVFARAVVERLVEGEPGLAHLVDRGVVGDQLGEPGVAAGAVPDQALDLGDQGRVEGAQLQLRPELEEGVGA